MIFLKNDYSEGMHPKVLDAIIASNEEQHIGYGCDTHSINACDLIRKRINKPDADVHLLVGGTQTNLIAISAFLRPFEAVIATNTAHISVHETGAIEASGHKVIEVPSTDGKITVEMIRQAVMTHTDEHMVKPKLVYISNATELGTVYSKSELISISKFCKDNNLFFYIDGARISTALTCDINDITLEEFADLCDAFYIGGTKNGAMFGEALIIINDKLKSYMRFFIKQKGGLLAKGRFLGIQFTTLINNDLFLEIARHTNNMGKLLADGLRKLKFEFLATPQTNMIFILLPKIIHKELSQFCHYETEYTTNEDYIIARFVTSFATPKEDIKSFLNIIEEIKEKTSLAKE